MLFHNKASCLPLAFALVAVGQGALHREELSVLEEPLLVELVQVDLLVARLRHRLVDVRHLKTSSI